MKAVGNIGVDTQLEDGPITRYIVLRISTSKSLSTGVLRTRTLLSVSQSVSQSRVLIEFIFGLRERDERSGRPNDDDDDGDNDDSSD